MSSVGSSFPILVNQTSLVPNSTYRWVAPMANGYEAKDKQLALTQFTMYNAIPNIASNLNNISFTYSIAALTTQTGLPSTVNLIPQGTTSGVYVSITDINNILQAVMFSNGHYMLDRNSQPYYFLSIAAIAYGDRFAISTIPIPSQADLTDASSPWYQFTYPATNTPTNGITPFGYQFPSVTSYLPATGSGVNVMQLSITSSQSGLATTIGFPVGIYPSSSTITGTTHGTQTPVIIASPNIPQIATVTSLALQCNWATISQFGNVAKQVAQIPINAAYNSTIIYAPPYPTWVSVTNGKYNSFEITLCQQDGTPLVNNLEAVSITMTFIIKDVDDKPNPPPIPQLATSLPPTYSTYTSMSGGGIEMTSSKDLKKRKVSPLPQFNYS